MSLLLGALDLEGKRILVVEDDYIQATSMAEVIRRHGGQVVGPVPNVPAALRLIEAEGLPHAAILDIHLGSEASFPIAALLHEKGVPMIFVTGYDDWFLPDDLEDVAVFQKPMDPDNVVRLLMPRRPG